ncbi:MAG: hypothetical protein M3063_08765 [Actinomycetota bacterium]|nr:hypothetical protein [Actinomycetota bacterium]
MTAAVVVARRRRRRAHDVHDGVDRSSFAEDDVLEGTLQPVLRARGTV